MRPDIALLFFAGLLAACTTFPELDAAVSESARNAPYPTLEPVDGLIIRALGPRRAGASTTSPDSNLEADLMARINLLKRRAAILRGAPVDAATRELLSAL